MKKKKTPSNLLLSFFSENKLTTCTTFIQVFVNARLHVSGGALGGGRMVEDSSSVAGIPSFSKMVYAVFEQQMVYAVGNSFGIKYGRLSVFWGIFSFLISGNAMALLYKEYNF